MEHKGEVVVNWDLGLHIRPATNIAKLLQKFSCEVTLSNDRVSCNAKSILQMMTLEAGTGDKISIHAQGKDAKEAIQALQFFFQEYKDHEDEDEAKWW